MFDQPAFAKTIASLLVIFDLDETLIHATEQPLARDPDFAVGPFPIYKRPFTEELLVDCARSARWPFGPRRRGTMPRRSWNTSYRKMSGSLRLDARALHPALHVRGAGVGWIKDLKKVKKHGFPLERVLMVDDIPGNLARQYGNYVRVTPYLGDEDDRELALLARYLRELRGVENVRMVEKRGWQRRFSLTDTT